MGIKNFIKSVKSSLGLKDFNKEGKKNSLKSLLNKLKKRKITINNSLESSLKTKEEKELQEELEIISLQIKKGEKLLNKLSSEQ